MADLTIGALVDPGSAQRTDTPFTLDSGDLTTHGVIVGMTGSGKTGLGIVLIEECLATGIPTLLIDPKGDLTNLCLTFPSLAPADFVPWVNPGDAQKAGQSVEEYAAAQANLWREGLSSWGIDEERIAKLHSDVEFTIYTPGSNAGTPINIVGALDAPAAGADPESVRAEVEGYVSGLLGLVGIDADPLASREHILLSNLIETSWAAGVGLDLASLVAQVVAPPMRKLGVMEIDAFFPAADRHTLAMRINGLIASPAFSGWSQGDPLDIDRLLYTADGRPRCAIITTAHLSDEQRMFVTAAILGKTVTWMRTKSGTTDLRALIYMDEVAGYVPPVAAPAAKAPILTILKQARAFGVGMVLSTQNPIDIDYRAIGNAGTWMIGRLQTERDKARLLDGLGAVDGSTNVGALGESIATLGRRQFAVRRAGRDEVDVMTTRWAMSYLRGPLTREQISRFSNHDQAETAPLVTDPGTSHIAADADGVSTGGDTHPDLTPVMPRIAADTPVYFADPGAPWLSLVGADPRGAHRAAAIVARVNLRYRHAPADLVHEEEYEVVLFPVDGSPEMANAVSVDYDDRDFTTTDPAPGTLFRVIGTDLSAKATWTRLRRDLVDHLTRTQLLDLSTNRELKVFARPGEDNDAFAERCRDAATQRADQELAKLRSTYEARLRRAQEQRATAHDRFGVLEAQQRERRNEDLMSAATTVLGGLLSGRRGSRGLARAAQRGLASSRPSATAQRRIDAARDKVARLDHEIHRLEIELHETVAEITARWDDIATRTEVVSIPAATSQVRVEELALAWLPVMTPKGP